MTVDEALPRVDKLLDDAALSERREIRVVHGFGSGRLKKAVAGLLDGHPHVASWRLGQITEGRWRGNDRGAQGLAMAFPEGFIEEVRRAADIVKVISDHVALKKMGTSWKGLCPFHEEKTPSFNVRQEPAVFHCFGCGEGGDVFKFLMLRERTSFPETLETLARRFGVPVPEGRFEPGPDRKEREALLALAEAAAQHFERTLGTAPGAAARDYLLGRGFKGRDPQAHPSRRGPGQLGRPARRAPGPLLRNGPAEGGPRPGSQERGGPLRPLPQQGDLSDPERVRARSWASEPEAWTARSPST